MNYLMAQTKYYWKERFFFPPWKAMNYLVIGATFGESHYTASSTSISDNVISSECALTCVMNGQQSLRCRNSYGKQLLAFILSLGVVCHRVYTTTTRALI